MISKTMTIGDLSKYIIIGIFLLIIIGVISVGDEEKFEPKTSLATSFSGCAN